MGELTLLLAVVTPALATGPGDAGRDRRGPPRNVLLLHAYPRLSPPVVGVDEAFRATLEAESPFPVYFYTEYLDLTLFDGDAPQRELRALLRRKYESRSIDLIGRTGARLALRVLSGERPDPTDVGTTMAMVDWRELHHWGLDERRLPSGSVVLFREPSVWERHRWLIVGAVALLLLQSALIAALLVHRALRRRVQRAIAERLRFETLLSDLSAMFATGPVAEVDRQIETGLRRLVADLGADRVTVAPGPGGAAGTPR